MRNTKKITLTREVHETLVLRLRNQFRLFCEQCRVKRDFLTIDESTNIFGFATRELMQYVETQEVHGVETAQGLLLICRESLRVLSSVLSKK